MKKALTISEHAEMVATYKPHEDEGLSEYAERHGPAKDAARKMMEARGFPVVLVNDTLSNRRYVVHCESALERGFTIDAASLAAIPADALEYDSYCFPLLTALRPDLVPGWKRAKSGDKAEPR